MKTFVRIINQDWSRDGYKHLIIQILKPRYGGTRNMEPIADIRFQTDNHPSGYPDLPSHYGIWYGLRMEISSGQIDHFEYAIKVFRKVSKLYYGDHAPDIVLKTIGAIECQHTGQDFIPVSMNGCNEYWICVSGKEYAIVYAFSEEEAMARFNEDHSHSPEVVTAKIKRENITLEPTDLSAK